MTDKQIIERLKTDLDFERTKRKTLQAELKAKEQECEELKKWKETVVELFERTCRCKYLNEENNHCGFYNRKCIGRLNQCLYKNQQALTEIKEIAKVEIECKTYEIEHDCFNETRCKALNEHIDFTEQILQKISECEVECEE